MNRLLEKVHSRSSKNYYVLAVILLMIQIIIIGTIGIYFRDAVNWLYYYYKNFSHLVRGFIGNFGFSHFWGTWLGMRIIDVQNRTEIA